MTSCAVTDHGVMYGVVDFYRAAKEAGIHPVIGCEVYVCPDKALAYPGTKVLMKNDIPTTKNAVIERGLSAMMVENCGSADQHIYNSVEEIPDEVSYFSVVVVKEEKK